MKSDGGLMAFNGGYRVFIIDGGLREPSTHPTPAFFPGWHWSPSVISRSGGKRMGCYDQSHLSRVENHADLVGAKHAEDRWDRAERLNPACFALYNNNEDDNGNGFCEIGEIRG
jgi:hypothetical protein